MESTLGPTHTAWPISIGVQSPPPPPPPPTKHLDIFQGVPLRLPKPFSDQFPVRVCSCPLCITNRLCKVTGASRRIKRAISAALHTTGCLAFGPVVAGVWALPSPDPSYVAMPLDCGGQPPHTWHDDLCGFLKLCFNAVWTG